MTMTPQEFSAARRQLGLSQAQLARVMDIRGPSGNHVISRWERGARPLPPRAAMIMQLLLTGARPPDWEELINPPTP